MAKTKREEQPVRIVSWNEYQELVETLSDQLRVAQPVHQWDVVNGIPRGGVIIAVSMSHILDIPYAEQSNCVDNRVLLLDDIVDSGRTMKPYVGHFHTGSLFVRRGSRVVPTYYSEIIEDDTWIVFPWEVEEREKGK